MFFCGSGVAAVQSTIIATAVTPSTKIFRGFTTFAFTSGASISKDKRFIRTLIPPFRSLSPCSSSSFDNAISSYIFHSPCRRMRHHRRYFLEGYSKKFLRSNRFSLPPMDTIITDNDDDEASSSNNKHSDYEKWVRRLYATNMFHSAKLGLDNMRLLHKLIGNPMDDPNRLVIHVAGTNGKGSVCLKIANALRCQERTSPSPTNLQVEWGQEIRAGRRKKHNVGLFCSPHVSSFRERMQVNGEMITEEEVVELLPQIYDYSENNDLPATFFEITTALAFLFFAKRDTDVVVLETGTSF